MGEVALVGVDWDIGGADDEPCALTITATKRRTIVIEVERVSLARGLTLTLGDPAT